MTIFPASADAQNRPGTGVAAWTGTAKPTDTTAAAASAMMDLRALFIGSPSSLHQPMRFGVSEAYPAMDC